MLSIINTAAPNVIPGANFNTERFQELFAWISAISADAVHATRTPFQYGLITAFDGQASLQLDKIGNCLTLNRCAGITPAGRIVGVFEGITPIIKTQLDQYELNPSELYQVLIEVHTSKRKAFGPVLEDIPQRQQFTFPAYRLHIQLVNQELGTCANAIPIGVLKYENGKWTLIDYIPPCVHIAANKMLNHKYQAYKVASDELLEALVSVIRQTDSFRDKAMIELREFSLQCGSFLAVRQHQLNALSGNGAPFDLVGHWMSFANLLSFLFDTLKDRSGFYNLLYQNTKSVNGVMFTTNRLDQMLSSLKKHNYNHHNIIESVIQIDEFLDLILPLFKALGRGILKSEHLPHEQVYQAQKPIVKKSYSTW